MPASSALQRAFVTRLPFRTEIKAYAPSPLSATLAGPSARLTGYVIPEDHSTASVPSDVTWTIGDNVTPREIAAMTTLSSEDGHEPFETC